MKLNNNSMVILSLGDDQGSDLRGCVVDGVCDAVAQHDLVGLGIGGLSVSCRGSRVVMARRSPRASARAWRRRVLSVSSSRMRCVATSMRRSREASEERWRSGTGRARKLTPEQVTDAWHRVEAGVAKAKIARELGCSRRVLYDVLSARGAYAPSATVGAVEASG